MTTPLLTAEDVAAMFQVDPATVRAWAREGRIAASKTLGGKEWRFRIADVERAFEDGTTQTGATR